MISAFLLVIPVFALIFAGWLAGRTGVLGSAAAGEINRFVVWLALPAMLFNIIASANWSELWQPGFIAVFTLSGLLAMTVAMAVRFRGHRNLADAAIEGLNAGYSNIGFVGFPIVLAALGQEALVPATIGSIITMCVIFAATIVIVEVALQSRPFEARAAGQGELHSDPQSDPRRFLVRDGLSHPGYRIAGTGGNVSETARWRGRSLRARGARVVSRIEATDNKGRLWHRDFPVRLQADPASAPCLAACPLRVSPSVVYDRGGGAAGRASRRHRIVHVGGILSAGCAGFVQDHYPLDARLDWNAIIVPGLTPVKTLLGKTETGR
ncbi:hypothetical protein J2046_006694 [Rhizobium petrolearium]|nr:hypothetical protein [Neorhizobium petrolearium]